MNPIFQWILLKVLKQRMATCSACGRVYYEKAPVPGERRLCEECRKNRK